VYEFDLDNDNDEAWNFSNRVMEFTVPLNSRNYMTTWGTTSFWNGLWSMEL